jgi:hypothetical protein
MRIEHAHRTFKALTQNMPISGWVSRACAKHHADHDTLRIPTLVAKDGDPLETRPCPLIYYYEQLLEDMKHIVTHNFETIPRIILEPIPRTPVDSPSRKSRSAPTVSSSAPTVSSSSMVTVDEQPTSRKQLKKRFRKKVHTADEHFQELAKDIHESNKNIPNPYEGHDSEGQTYDQPYKSKRPS